MSLFKLFLKEPHRAVIMGYVPNVIDCWAVFANNDILLWRKYFYHLATITSLFDMRIKDLFWWLVTTFFTGLFLITLPFLFWVWGTILFFSVKNTKANHEERMRKLDDLI